MKGRKRSIHRLQRHLKSTTRGSCICFETLFFCYNKTIFMKLSVVIPAYNEEKYIGACLDELITTAGSDIYEIIVVDNASTDRTAAVARKYKGVKVVREDRKGLTRARQAGLMA